MATQLKEVDAELVRHYSAVNELLRHFWACFPTRTPLLEQKVIYKLVCILSQSTDMSGQANKFEVWA